MRTMKEIFEFLKPNKKNLISAVIITIAAVFIFGKIVIPKMMLEAPVNLYSYMLISMAVGIFIVAYTLISIIVYFVTGRYKD